MLKLWFYITTKQQNGYYVTINFNLSICLA